MKVSRKYIVPVDWVSVLAKADRRKYFTEQERQWARNWNSCAISWVRQRKPQFVPVVTIHPIGGGAPMDMHLDRLGLDFMTAVNADDVLTARELFLKIQLREIEIERQRIAFSVIANG